MSGRIKTNLPQNRFIMPCHFKICHFGLIFYSSFGTDHDVQIYVNEIPSRFALNSIAAIYFIATKTT